MSNAEIDELKKENERLRKLLEQATEDNKMLFTTISGWRDDVCKLSVRNTKLNEELIARSLLETVCTAILILGSLGWWVWG